MHSLNFICIQELHGVRELTELHGMRRTPAGVPSTVPMLQMVVGRLAAVRVTDDVPVRSQHVS